MKATRYIFAATLAVIAAVACQKESMQKTHPEIIINATIDNTETKTVLGEGFTGTDGKVHHKVLWACDKSNESFSLFDGAGNNHRFITYDAKNAKEDLTSANFYYYAHKDYTTSFDTFTAADTYYALYPLAKGNKADRKSNTVTISTIPADQIAVLNGFENDLAVAFGTSNSTYTTEDDKHYINMSFTNLTALIKFEITGEDITQIRFTNNSDALSPNPTLYGSGITYNYVDKSFGDGKGSQIYLHNTISESEVDGTATYSFTPLSAGVYYIVVIPRTLVPRVDIYTGTSHTGTHQSKAAKTIKGTKAVDLKPGMILDLGKFNSSGRVTE